jgi:hypothetical protein
LLDLLRRIQTIQGESDARRSEDARVRVSEVVLMHFEIAESIASAQTDGDRTGLPERSPPIP